jgi:hypothetical protein
MSYDNPRRTRLLREALGDDTNNLPTAAYTFWTIGLIALSLVIIVLAGLDLPESTVYVPSFGTRHASATVPAAASTLPNPSSTAEYGNVVDLTF